MQQEAKATGSSSVFRWPVVRSALMVAVVVGSVLNLINQGDALLSGGPVNWLKLCLTYCVPFCVSLYGAHSALRLLPGGKSG